MWYLAGKTARCCPSIYRHEGNSMARPQFSDWRVLNFRVTFFCPNGVPEGLRDGGAWQAITGVEPATSVTTAAQGTFEESGPIEGGMLSATVASDRLDVVVTYVNNRDPMGFPSAVSFSDEYLPFVDFVSRGLTEKLFGVGRVAFGAIALCPRNSRAEAYETLGEMVPALRLDEGMRDVYFQINRPRTSAIFDGMLLNRLSRWNCVLMRQLRLDPHGSAVPTIVQYDATRVEVDFSTPAEMAELPDDAICPALTELASLAAKVIEQGDH